MYLLAPFIFAVLFMILVAFSSCIFKIIFKIKSFVGFGSGICCSILTDVIASIYMVVVLLAIMTNLVDDAQKMANNTSTTTTNPNTLLNYTKGGIFLLWLFFTVLMGIVFIFIFFFTKRISKPEDDYNSVFMFISGYILLPFLFFYLIWMIVTGFINAGIDELIKRYGSDEQGVERAVTEAIGTLGSFFFTLVDFVGLFAILLFAGTIIMCMLHHRKVNSLIIFICIGCFFSPAIFIFLYSLATFFVTYLLILPSCASIGLGIFFYLRYAVEGSSTTGYAQPQASYQLAS